MPVKNIIAFTLLGIVYLIFTSAAQRKLINEPLISRKQLILHSILIWSIPFVWYFMINSIYKNDSQVVTKKVRDARKKEKDERNAFRDNAY